MINAHDHLHRNHHARLGEPPYPDVYAWGEDLHRRFGPQIERARRLPRRDALLFGALKNLLGGATTVAHHDAWEETFSDGFPVRVPRIRHVHTLALASAESLACAAAGDGTLLLHLAEGVGTAAADEVRRAAEAGLVGPDLVAVHCVAVDGEGARTLAAAGAAVVWCPTSNQFLYGRGPSTELLHSGVDVLLGTDALLTGAGTLFDELRAARATRVLGDEALLAAVGATAARRLGVPEPSLAPGAPADLVVLRAEPFEARAADVALVIMDGRPRLADETFRPLFEALAIPALPIRVGGAPRWVEVPVAEAAARVREDFPEACRILV